MQTNEAIDRLGPNPFTRLRRLLDEAGPPRVDLAPLPLHIGEPMHQPPAMLAETIAAQAGKWNEYPPVEGTLALRGAITGWLGRRYGLPQGMLDPARHVLALNGTREGLFLLPQMAVPEQKAGSTPAVLLPNPFYQVYLGAAALARAETVPLPATRETGFLPDLDALSPELLERTALFYLCTPANPQGAIATLDYLQEAIDLARAHEFVLAVDECYSEIYDGAAPPGALEAAARLGGGLDNLLVFHSLSKRSNAAGLRAGFVAGDPDLIRRFFVLRTYAAAQVPLPIQAAAAALWNDEAHVVETRARYRAKIDAAERVLGSRHGFYRPQGGFFLWLEVGDSEEATRRLWREAAVKVLPGAYIGLPDADGFNPGADYIRVALVHDEAIVTEALTRLDRVL
jgi:aspartate/methionine/tyrosine aminotransferase